MTVVHISQHCTSISFDVALIFSQIISPQTKIGLNERVPDLKTTTNWLSKCLYATYQWFQLIEMDAAVYLYMVGLFLVARVISLYPKCRGKTYGHWIMVWNRMVAWTIGGHHCVIISRVWPRWILVWTFLWFGVCDYVSQNNFLLIPSLREKINGRLLV